MAQLSFSLSCKNKKQGLEGAGGGWGSILIQYIVLNILWRAAITHDRLGAPSWLDWSHKSCNVGGFLSVPVSPFDWKGVQKEWLELEVGWAEATDQLCSGVEATQEWKEQMASVRIVMRAKGHLRPCH